MFRSNFRIRAFASALLLLLPLGSIVGSGSDRGTAPVLGIRDGEPTPLAFVGARIVVSPERTIESGTLVLRDGRVAAVGMDVRPPAGSRVIDAGGLTLLPGFIDPLTEYGLGHVGVLHPPKSTSAPQYVGTRVGVDAWNDALHPERDWIGSYRPDREAAERFLAHGVTVVRSAKLDGILRGRSFVASLADDQPAATVLVPRATPFASFNKGSSQQAYPSSLMGSIALLRQTLLDARWYAAERARHASDPSRPAPEANDALDALATYDGEIVFETDDALSLLRAARLAAEFGLQLQHVGAHDEYRHLEALRALDRPLILPLDFPEVPRVGSADEALDVTLSALRLWERAPANPATLDAAGVRFAFTMHRLEPGSDPLAAVRRAVRHGLSPESALAALTRVPAELVGLGAVAGTLEPGRLANVVAVEGDPFTDDDARIRAVWIAGRPAWASASVERTDFRGVWSLAFAGTSYELTLRGKVDAPDGTLVTGDAKAELRGIESGERRLTFRVELEPPAGDGIVRVEMLRVGDETRAWIALPDGRRVEAELRRVGAAAAAPADAEAVAKRERRRADERRIVSRLTYPDVGFGFEKLPERRDLLVRNATVWTGEAEGVLEGADLLVVDGSIRAVGRGIDAPRGALVIDGTGKHVTAGILDEHSHLAISRGVNEGSHAVTAEVRIGDVVDSTDINIYRALAGGVTVAQLLHGSANPIGGQAQVIKLRWGRGPEDLKFTAAPATIKFALGENVKQSNWGGEFTTRYPQSRMGVRTAIEDALLSARDYLSARAAWEALSPATRANSPEPRRDLRLEALGEVLTGQRFAHVHSYVQSEMLMLLQLAEELGFRVQTFTHALEAYKVAPELARHGAGASTFSDWWAYKFEVYDAIPYNTCLLHERGVVTSVNSDSSNVIRRLNQEAGKSVYYCDMDPAEAWNLVTLNPARQLRVDDRVGSLRPGKDGDFVIWSGSPLSTTSRAEQTWIEGVRYFDVESDLKLRRAVAEERSALVDKALRAGSTDKAGGRASRKPTPEHRCDEVEDVWR